MYLNSLSDKNKADISISNKKQPWRRFWRSFDTIRRAGLEPDKVQSAGVVQRIKDLHNPKTYLVLALLSGLRWDWCFRNPYYWFGVAFCVKWYRARYVFKIPVWDRQPNWNNIITSKEQEKDLKAFTCKKCGSTLFIAKTREFFFEGSTGIGGLGCFACGAKGKENFVMDRDRIVEDVADVDDYFEYERPLDFVSAAERRKILKETSGDVEAANQLLVDRANAATAANKAENEAAASELSNDSTGILDAEIVEDEEKDGDTAVDDDKSRDVTADEDKSDRNDVTKQDIDEEPEAFSSPSGTTSSNSGSVETGDTIEKDDDEAKSDTFADKQTNMTEFTGTKKSNDAENASAKSTTTVSSIDGDKKASSSGGKKKSSQKKKKKATTKEHVSSSSVNIPDEDIFDLLGMDDL